VTIRRFDGQEIVITVAGKEVRAKASVHANRRFEGAGVRFDFPRDMAVGTEPGAAMSQWTLDGDDCVILVNAFDDGDAADLAADVLANTLRALDAKAAPATACTVSLGGKDHAALRGRARMAGTVIEVTSVWLVAGGKAVTLMLQDSLGDDGKATPEATRVLELLKTTFAVAAGK
jgi:hypothetical protein